MSYVDALPGAITIALSLLALLVVPHGSPEYLLVDQWRYYGTVAAVTVILWLILGYLFVRLAGATRPIMALLSLTGLLILPVGIAPLVGWLNARLDGSPETVVVLRVSGYKHHGRTGLIAVRLRTPSLPEIEAEKMTSFFPTPVPAEGAPFRGTYHAGTFGIRWLASLRPMTVGEAESTSRED